MTVALPFTRLIRLLVPFGRIRLPVLPAPIRNCENELKALGPLTVPVVTVLTLPFVVTAVAVRPSGMICVTPAGTLWAKVSVGASVITTAIAAADTRSDFRSMNSLGDRLNVSVARAGP